MKNRDDLQQKLSDATRDWRFARSNSDAAYYEYQTALHEGRPTEKLKKKLDDISAEIAAHAKEMDGIDKEIQASNAVIAGFTDTADSLEAALKALYVDANKLQAKLEGIRRSPIAIRQVLLNDFDKSNFGEVKARVDRCQTCHAGYNDKNMVDAPQPFTTHSNPELLKIHNPEKYGCSSCHHGQAFALTAALRTEMKTRTGKHRFCGAKTFMQDATLAIQTGKR